MTNKRSYDLLGIGNAILDIIARKDDAFIKDNGISKGTMTLIDEAASQRLHGALDGALEFSGGSAANSMAVFASLGGKGAFIGKVADDLSGDIFTQDIQSSGIHFPTQPLSGGPSTARCMVMVTPDAERTMCTYLGACSMLSVDDLDHDLIRNTSVTLLEGYLFDKDTAKEAFREASRIARAAGNKVALTLSDEKCVERHHASFTDLVKNHTDILFANESEIMALYKAATFEEAAEKVSKDCAIAVLTRGGKGALIVTPQEMIPVAPAKIDRLVDTTGAGDSFSAAFLYGYTQGKPLVECGMIAAVVAGEIISQFGARPQRKLSDVVQEKMSALPSTVFKAIGGPKAS